MLARSLHPTQRAHTRTTALRTCGRDPFFQAYCFRNIAELKGKPLNSHRLCVYPVRAPSSIPHPPFLPCAAGFLSREI